MTQRPLPHERADDATLCPLAARAQEDEQYLPFLEEPPVETARLAPRPVG